MDANGPIICIHLQVCRGLWKDTFYILLSKLPEFTSHQLTNTIGKCSYVQLYHIQVAGLCTFLWPLRQPLFLPRLVLALLLLWALSTAGAACEHLRTKELTYIENNWDNHKGNHPDRSERSEDKGSRLTTRSLQGHGQSKLTHHVRHSIVDAALFQHLSRKMNNTPEPKQIWFCLLCCWALSFSFWWPFRWALAGSFGCNHRCLRVHRHQRYWKWIRLNMVE